MVDPVEVVLKVDVYNPFVSRRYVVPGGFHGLMGASTRTKSVARVTESGLEQGCQDLE